MEQFLRDCVARAELIKESGEEGYNYEHLEAGISLAREVLKGYDRPDLDRPKDFEQKKSRAISNFEAAKLFEKN